MRLSKEQVEANRKKVLREAGRLFRERGFGSIGLADVMQAAGFTHGGFYNHFGSKTELETAVATDVLRMATRTLDKAAADPDSDKTTAYADYVGRYLSLATRDAPGRSCPIAALAADVAREAPPVRQAFADGLQSYLDSLAAVMPDPQASRSTAIVALSAMLGAVVLARATAGVEEDFSRDILATVEAALTGGRTPAEAAKLVAG
jgi:TetR/AcrR family transcriptional repressor of nem operon